MNKFKRFFDKQSIEDTDEYKAVSAELEAVKVVLDTIKEDLKTAQEEAAHYQLQFTELNEKYEALVSDNSELLEDNVTLAQEQSSVELKAAEAAVEIVSEVMGETPVAITDDSTEQPSLLEKLSTLKGVELAELYNAHKDEIFKLLKH